MRSESMYDARFTTGRSQPPAKRSDLEPDTDGCNSADDGGEDGACEEDDL